MSPPLSLLLQLLILLLPFPSSSSSSTTIVAFDFPSFSLRNLTLLGSSSLLLGSISLTHPPSSSSSSGAAVLSLPVPFADPAANASASFSTAFSFSITNPCTNPTHGDGLAFFLSADPLPFGAPGLHLGLFNASAFPPPDPPAIVAVEFDTLLDEGFNGPSPNHVVSRPMSRPERNPHRNKKLSIGLGVVGPAAAGVALMVFVCLSLGKKNIEVNGNDKRSLAPEIANRPRLFRYTEIYNATRGFHSDRIIGEGGFGTVYKFVSPETGATCAMKR